MFPVQVQKLTKTQMRNLLKGKGARIKIGTASTLYLSEKQYKGFYKNSKLGKAYTLKLSQEQLAKQGSGLFGDVYNFVKRTPFLKEAANAAIRGGKKYAHKGIDYLSNRAHSKIEEFPTIGDGLKRGRIIKGKGILGDVISFINPTAGAVAKTIGLGMKKRTRRGKGFLGDVLKAGAKAVAQKGIEAGANYLSNKVEGMGMKRKRKATQAQLNALAIGRAIRDENRRKKGFTVSGSGRARKKYSGAALLPAGYSK